MRDYSQALTWRRQCVGGERKAEKLIRGGGKNRDFLWAASLARRPVSSKKKPRSSNTRHSDKAFHGSCNTKDETSESRMKGDNQAQGGYIAFFVSCL